MKNHEEDDVNCFETNHEFTYYELLFIHKEQSDDSIKHRNNSFRF